MNKCNTQALCEECPYYNGFECEATERQRAFIGKYSGYGKIELMSVCYDKDERIAELEKQHDIDNQVIELMEDNREKVKISFAVEQLEQVKYYILTTQQDADYLVDKEQVNIHFFKDVIDNQIKKLTHQHEDKGE